MSHMDGENIGDKTYSARCRRIYDRQRHSHLHEAQMAKKMNDT